jgi:hypothetical protein
MHKMDDFRQKLRLVHTGHLRVIFEAAPGIGFLVPSFECSACERNLEWNLERSWWNCPECGYELTPDEALGITKQLGAGLTLLRRDVSRRRQSKGPLKWLLEKLFGRQKSLPPSSGS